MPALLDLSERLKLRIGGSDRVRYLNGQVTNDARKANERLTMAACVLSAKGKMDALIFLTVFGDQLLIDAEAELRETLPARLERYVIADDVTIEDVSDELALFHVIGERAPELPNEPDWRRSKRFGVAGWDLFVEASERERLRQLLASKMTLLNETALEQFRIEQGVPRWGRELSNEIIPVEANLEAETIDYAKGCYIGQEVISRMKMSGQTNKRLRGLFSLGSALAPGMRLFSENGEREAGWVTSAARSDSLGKEIALGFVRRGNNEAGTRLRAKLPNESGEGTAIEVVELPFAAVDPAATAS